MKFKLNKELAKQFKETDRRLRLLGEQLAGLGNKLGSFTEGLAYPSQKFEKKLETLWRFFPEQQGKAQFKSLGN